MEETVETAESRNEEMKIFLITINNLLQLTIAGKLLLLIELIIPEHFLDKLDPIKLYFL